MSPMLEVFISHGDMAVGTWYLSDDSLPGSLLTSLMLFDTRSSVTIMGLYTRHPTHWKCGHNIVRCPIHSIFHPSCIILPLFFASSLMKRFSSQ